ncbi:MAG TPA: prepilin-type N-terminal cleavage/methylation domain-containing protein [Thermoanaerobaculia bacterium]|jgi:prepilin-type N-terminal cleavage/methylation domain-containing protein|nr:prepilin-type N-terminal cleavage/methylation domain-containing protein [Thermoanaerobaculia bacterium]
MRQRGFALLELLIALVLVSLALGLTAQLLMESSQMLTAAAAEQTDAPMPLVLARIRGDVRASGGFDVVEDRLYLLGHPAGTVVYERDGRELRRTVLDQHGVIRGSSPALRGVTQWSCGAIGPRLLLVTIGNRRSRLRAGVLPQMPSQRGPVSEERVESILVAPRGAGLGLSW